MLLIAILWSLPMLTWLMTVMSVTMSGLCVINYKLDNSTTTTLHCGSTNAHIYARTHTHARTHAHIYVCAEDQELLNLFV